MTGARDLMIVDLIKARVPDDGLYAIAAAIFIAIDKFEVALREHTEVICYGLQQLSVTLEGIDNVAEALRRRAE